jgi:hypothetical protein
MEQLDPDPFLADVASPRPAVARRGARLEHGAAWAATSPTPRSDKVETPAYVTDLGALEDNLKHPGVGVPSARGVKIILALKGFAQWSTFPLVKRYLKGTTSVVDRRGAAGPRGVRRRGPRLRAGVERRRTCARS